MGANESVRYSVVVPVFNSALSLPELCESIVVTLANDFFEIILVDDASTDESWSVIQKLKKEYPLITAVQHATNKGQAMASFTGFGLCKGRYIITIDDDLQFHPSDIAVLIRRQEETGADIVYGLAKKGNHSWFRNRASSGLKRMARVGGFHFTGSSFRLLKKEVVQSLPLRKNASDVLIDVVFFKSTYRIVSVAVEHYKRKYGKSNYSVFRLLMLVLNSFALYCNQLWKTFHSNKHGD